MISLLRYFSLRYALKHPVRVGLSAMAVALGVALFVSSDTSNHSTEVAFRESNEKLQGNTQLHVIRGRMIGVEEEALKKVESVPGIQAAPVLQVSANLPEFKEEGTMLILGLDFKREASFRLWDVAEGDAPKVDMLAFVMSNAIIVTQSFAERHSLSLRSSFQLDTPTGTKKVVVGAVLKDRGPARVFGGDIAVMDLATAQKLFNRQGRLDRIEVMVSGPVGPAQEKIRQTLGEDYIVEPPPKSNTFMDDAMARIRALMGISAIALVVSIFIIYNSVSISVVQRIKEIGTLRAFGATQKQIFGVVLMEWAIVGCIGSLAGVGIGFNLARALIRMTAREVNQLVPIVNVKTAVLAPRTLVLGLILGILTTQLAAYFPARQAMRIAPIELLRQGIYRLRLVVGYNRLFWVGLGMILISMAIWLGATSNALGLIRLPNIGLASALLSFSGAAFILPQLTFWLARAMRPYLGRLFHIEAYLASDNISKFPQRTALTVIALAGALAMMVSAAGLILSFKVRGERWMRVTFPFDCAINATDLSNSFFSDATFPEELKTEVDKLDSIHFTYGVRSVFLDFKGRSVMLIAPEMEKYEEMHRARGEKQFIPDENLQKLISGDVVAVSENFAAIHRLKRGDKIQLTTLHGPRSFEITGMIEDYSWPQGVIFMDRKIYTRFWEDSSLTYLNIKFKPGVDVDKGKHEVAGKIRGSYNLFVYSVEDLLDLANSTMDQTLRFTNIQVAVAILIGFLGIVNTLLISVMQRTREIGLLRAVGMTRMQIVRMVVIESVFLAAVAAVLGIGLGLVGAKWPLALHVFQISGFLMPLAIPWKHVLGALGSAIVIGFLASSIPARQASRVNVLDAIGYE